MGPTWERNTHFAVSDDGFKTMSIHGFCGEQFEVIGATVYLGFSNSCPTDISGGDRGKGGGGRGTALLTSIDGGTTFTEGCLPADVGLQV